MVQAFWKTVWPVLKKLNIFLHAIQNLWDAAKAVLRGNLIASYTSLPQETRKISNKQSNLTPKGTRERTNKTES